MHKKKIIPLIILIICLQFCNVKAYDFVDPKNEDFVNNMITDIYDAKQQYEDLSGGYEETKVKIYNSSNSSYWWPVGSMETTDVDGVLYATGDPATTHITSNFGYRSDPFGGGSSKFHSGLDVSGGHAPGTANVIAAKDGIVVYPSKGAPTNCPFSSQQSKCGGGYGNYVIIQHSDGNYTLYAHMHENTITVTAGDSVSQGQVIGKMGSSGNSTGTHLHFEVREGQNSYSAAVNPLNYISAETPRFLAIGGELLSWLNSWEGLGKKDGDYYIVEDIGDGVRTVGSGVTLENNPDSFQKYGINIADYPTGSKIPINIVDSIELEEINSRKTYIENVLAKNSITLKQNEIEALISQMYNCGNINGFVDSYKRYGNTDDFYNNWFFRNTMKGTKFETGLTRRRNSEWTLFHAEKYVYNK